MTKKFTLLQSDVPTVNGRIYPKEILEEIHEAIQSRTLLGITLHDLERYPELNKCGGLQSMMDVSHSVNNSELVEVDGALRLNVEVTIIDNPPGIILKNIFEEIKKHGEDDVVISVIPRGQGKTNEKQELTEYKIAGIDIWICAKKYLAAEGTCSEVDGA